MEVERFNFNLSQLTANELRQVTDRKGLSKTEALHKAFAVYKFVSDEKDAGRKLRTIDRDGREPREIVIIW